MKMALMVVAMAIGPWLSALVAQPPPGPPAPAVVIQFLQFSEAQAGQFQQLLMGLQAAIAPIEQQVSIRQQRLEGLLSAAQPDPAAIGALVLEIRTLEKQGQQALQSYHDGFLALLTPEQQQKTAAVAQAGQLLPAVKAFAEVRLIEPPH